MGPLVAGGAVVGGIVGVGGRAVDVEGRSVGVVGWPVAVVVRGTWVCVGDEPVGKGDVAPRPVDGDCGGGDSPLDGGSSLGSGL